MELIKVKNPKNHTVVVAGKHLKPGDVMDLPRTEIVLYAVKVGLLEEVPTNAKQAAPVKQEPAKQEPAKQEPAKQEPAKQEPVKQETTKPVKKEEKKKK